MQSRLAIALLAASVLSAPAFAHGSKLDAKAIEQAGWHNGRIDRALVAKAQIILDRINISPGVIDGRRGGNTRKAIEEFQKENGLDATGKLDRKTWMKLSAKASGALVTSYKITADDVKGPFTKHIPAHMKAQAKLDRLGYRNPTEELAEKFHVTQAMLKTLNPGKRFDRKGTKIEVPAVTQDSLGDDPVARIVVEKGSRDVKAFDKQGKMLAFFPATIGSRDKPAPSGTLKVVGVARHPTYTYSPKYDFKGVHAKQKFTIAPGPNNPVGVVWIGLSGEGYGIHGTPDPKLISKDASHGCIRLTNWDALELARDVKKGIPVEFRGG